MNLNDYFPTPPARAFRTATLQDAVNSGACWTNRTLARAAHAALAQGRVTLPYRK